MLELLERCMGISVTSARLCAEIYCENWGVYAGVAYTPVASDEYTSGGQTL